MIRLTTTLVHASGEWVSSDWPVCPISETAAPHRMGAALTYARRYALFTLVGIAGEDDLDAPDLALKTGDPGPQNSPPEKKNGSMTPAKGFHKFRKGANGAGILSPEASANLRDQLLDDLAGIASQDDLDAWALRTWPKANGLTPSDGDEVRHAFQARLARLPTIPGVDLGNRTGPTAGQRQRSSPHRQKCFGAVRGETAQRQAASTLRGQTALPRLRRQPCDAHHLRFAQSRGLGLKVSDEFAVPLCRAHHRELHRAGKEIDWWGRTGIEPIDIARRLWLETHPLAISASRADGGSAALETKLLINETETAAVPKQLRRMEMAKRTQLPGSPT